MTLEGVTIADCRRHTQRTHRIPTERPRERERERERKKKETDILFIFDKDRGRCITIKRN